jgi:malate permease and related proteins
VILVAATVIAATTAGIFLEHTTAFAPQLARRCLSLMLYALVPFVAYTSFAHLHLSIDAGVGLALAYLGLGTGGALAYIVGKSRLALSRPSLGALICCVLLVNTAYLGLPMTVAVLGTSRLSQAVAYDQVVSGPMLFTVGFAVGAAFGTRVERASGRRMLAVVTRNPPLLAAIAGLLVPSSFAPHPLVAASHVVVDALLVIGFVTVGISLSTERREDAAPLLERPDRRVGVALVLRFATTTAVLGLASLVGVAIPSAYLLQAAMPSGVNSLIVGHAFGLDQRLIATMIVWSTLAVLVVGVAASVL